MTHPVIRVENLGKQYELGMRERLHRTFRETIMDAAAAPLRRLRHLSGKDGEAEHIWALRDVSFEVQHGEVLGIIGRNGAGKSTLLKILTKITEPTTGRAEIRGRVGSLLEVGTGFHPELTGRENIWLNGAILGMTRTMIRRKFDEIVDFSGVEKFLDTPVKRYSSGMAVRLAFSVAAHLDPEILLIDEVLAVGDSEFQRKCLGKMGKVACEGRTVLFVSHNMSSVVNLCSRAVLLEAGRFVHDGSAEETVTAYRAGIQPDCSNISLADRTDRQGNGSLLFTDLSVYCPYDHGVRGVLVSGRHARFTLTCRTQNRETLHNVSVAITIVDSHGSPVATLFTRFLNQDFQCLGPLNQLCCDIPRLPLAQGSYSVRIWSAVGGQALDVIDEAARFTVTEGDFFGSGRVVRPAKHGPILIEHNWTSHDCVTDSHD